MEQETLLKAGVKLLGLYFAVSGIISFVQYFLQLSQFVQNPPIHTGAFILLPIVQIVIGSVLIVKNNEVTSYLLRS